MRHVLAWKDDAARLDVADQPTPFFQWEVGFANGAFAVAGLLAVVLDWGVGAMAAVVLGYAMYLLQAALLNGRRYFSGQSRTTARLWGSFIGNGVAGRHGRCGRLLGALGRRARTVLRRRLRTGRGV